MITRNFLFIGLASVIASAPVATADEAGKQHLATGADVNAKNERRWTPLHIAAVEGHKEITELLIAKGARLISFEAHELGSIWGDKPKRSISPAQE